MRDVPESSLRVAARRGTHTNDRSSCSGQTLVLRTRRSAAGRSGRGLNGKLGPGVVRMSPVRPTEPVPGSRTLSHDQRARRKFSSATKVKVAPKRPRRPLRPTHGQPPPKEVARAALAPNSQALRGAERAAGAREASGSRSHGGGVAPVHQ